MEVNNPGSSYISIFYLTILFSFARLNKTDIPLELPKARKLSSDTQFFYPTYTQNGYSTIDETQLDEHKEPESIDRYNPRPYFGYGADPQDTKIQKPEPVFPSNSQIAPPSQENKPQPIFSSPQNNKPPPDPPNDSYMTALDDNQNDMKLVDSYKPPAAGPIGQPDFDYAFPPIKDEKEGAKPEAGQISDYPPDFDGYGYPKPSKPSTSTIISITKPPQDYYPSMVIDEPEPKKPKHPKFDPSNPPEYLDYNPDENGHHHHHHEKPHYIDHDYHHHVYHEVTTTTTEKPMDDERVNKRPYSYYYLGRKLWYIPLYFSLYFIVYIFALIVKSIIRHKVRFPNDHDWSHTRSGRTMRDDGKEVVNTVTEHVYNGLKNAEDQWDLSM